MSVRERSPRFRKFDRFDKPTRSHNERDHIYRREHFFGRRDEPYHRGRGREVYKDNDKNLFRSRYKRGRSTSRDHKERYPLSPKRRSPPRFSEDRLSHLSGGETIHLQRKSSDEWLRSISRNSNESIIRGSRSPGNIGRRELRPSPVRNIPYSPKRSRSRSFDRINYCHNRNRLSRRLSTSKDRHRRSSLKSNTPQKRSRSIDRRGRSGHGKTSVKSHSPYSRRRNSKEEGSPTDIRSAENLSRSSIQRQIQYELKRKELLEAQMRLKERRSESSIERLLNDCKESVEVESHINTNEQTVQFLSDDTYERSDSPVHRRRKFQGLGHITIERGKSLEKSVSPIEFTEHNDPHLDLHSTITIKTNVDEICSYKDVPRFKDVPLTASNSLVEEYPTQNDSITKLESSPKRIVIIERESPCVQSPRNALELSPISQNGSFEKESPERLDLSPVSLQDNFEQVDFLERQEIEARNKANLSPFSQEGSFKDFEINKRVSLSPISQGDTFDTHDNKNMEKVTNPLIERPGSADSMQRFLAELERSCERSGSSSERELSPSIEKSIKIIPEQKLQVAETRSSSMKIDKYHYEFSSDKRDDLDKYKGGELKHKTSLKYSATDNAYEKRYKSGHKENPVESNNRRKPMYRDEERNRYQQEISPNVTDWKKRGENSVYSKHQLHSSYSLHGKPFESSTPAGSLTAKSKVDPYDSSSVYRQDFRSVRLTTRSNALEHQSNSLFERRSDISQPSSKYSLQDPQTVQTGNGISQFGHLNSMQGISTELNPNSQASISYPIFGFRLQNPIGPNYINPSSNITSANLSLSNPNLEGKNDPLPAEELRRILNGFVIFFGVQKNSYLEKDPCVVIQESFSKSEHFGRLSVCFLSDDSSPQLISEKVCELRWRGMTLCRGRGATKSAAERKASIDLINTLARFSYIVQTKYQYYCGGDLPSFMIRDQEQADVYKIVRKSDVITVSSDQKTSRYGISKDVAAILKYIDKFFKQDTFCELLFGGSDLTEFTWQEMQKIIKHALDTPFLEYRMINGYNKGKFIAIGRSHTPQEICNYLLNYKGEHLRYRLLPPVAPTVNLLTPDGKYNPKSTIPVIQSSSSCHHSNYGGQYNTNNMMMYQPIVPPPANVQVPTNMGVTYDMQYNTNPMLPFNQPVVPPMPIIQAPTNLSQFPYDGQYNANPMMMYNQPVVPPTPVQPPAINATAKPAHNRVLRSIDVIEID